MELLRQWVTGIVLKGTKFEYKVDWSENRFEVTIRDIATRVPVFDSFFDEVSKTFI